MPQMLVPILFLLSILGKILLGILHFFFFLRLLDKSGLHVRAGGWAARWSTHDGVCVVNPSSGISPEKKMTHIVL